MGERKVLNKYYPPDFDPAKLPRGQRAKSNEMKVRMMLPMSVRCKTCGTFMYKGTKFNTRKEDVAGENYLGIQIFRFYWRCTNCAAEFTMKTDPQNSDYVLEHGATRNYEPWRDKDKAVAEFEKKREEEEMGNAMKALENRTLDSKREMDIMAALDEMKSLNARHNTVTTEQALAALLEAADKETGEEIVQDDDEDDLEAVKEFQQLRSSNIKRLEDDQLPSEAPSSSAPLSTKVPAVSRPSLPPVKLVVAAKRKAPESAPVTVTDKQPRGPEAADVSGAALLGLGDYASGSSDGGDSVSDS